MLARVLLVPRCLVFVSPCKHNCGTLGLAPASERNELPKEGHKQQIKSFLNAHLRHKLREPPTDINDLGEREKPINDVMQGNPRHP